MMLRTATRRPGLTLLEVIVGLVIFFLSVTAIFQLLILSTDRAKDVHLQARTSMRCQSKLAEVTIGAQGLDQSGWAFYDEPDKDLQWKMDVTPLDDKGLLYSVKITVKAELPTGRIVESQLVQMVVNPQKRGSTFDELKDPVTMGGN